MKNLLTLFYYYVIIITELRITPNNNSKRREEQIMKNIKKKVTKSFAQYGEVLRTRKNMNHSFRGKCKRELAKSC